MFTDLEKERLELEEVMKEKITIKRIVIVTLMQDVWVKPEEKPVSEFIKMMEIKRAKMPLFDVSPVTEPAHMPVVDEVRFAQIHMDKHESSVPPCEPGCDGCDYCRGTV